MAEAPIDSPESARAAVRAWMARPDRMQRIDELIGLLRRCQTELHLRFLAEAMVAGLRTIGSMSHSQLGIRSPDRPSMLRPPGASPPAATEFVEFDEAPASPPPDFSAEEIDIAAPALPPAPPPALPTPVKGPPERKPVVAPPPVAAPVERKSMIAPPSFAAPPIPSASLGTGPAPAAGAPLFVPAPVEFEKPEPAPPAPVVKIRPAAPPPPPAEEPRRSLPIPPPGQEPKTRSSPLPAAGYVEIQETPRSPMLIMPPPPPLAPAPEALPEIDPKTLPPGIDADIMADVMRVEQCRRIFAETQQVIEVWEVFCLVMMEGDRTRVDLERILALRAAGDTRAFTEGAEALFKKLLELRAKFGKFIQDVRTYLATLQVGRFGKEMIEMGLGFLVVSARGRDAAIRWLAEPKRSIPEASGRWESLIAKTMSYQNAISQIQAKKK